MRAISATQQAVLDNGNQAEFVRVQIKDSGGTFRDLTTYPTFNAVKTVQWGEQIDQPHATFTVTLFRELYQLSLSPYVQASALNRAFNPANAFGALLAVNRELKIECAIVAMDMQPASGDWFEVFRGRVDKVDPGKGDTIELSGRALSGRLAQQYIKYERVYSYAATGGASVALRIWEANQVYALNEYLLPASRNDADPGFNRFLKCSQAGTSGTTEPVWTGAANQVDGTAKWDYIGAPTTSGNPVEQVMQNILDDNKAASDSTVTLFTPSSPGWNITQFIQQRQFTMDGILALAQQIGWDLRYKWRASSVQFELTLSQPVRSAPSVNFTFGKSDYEAPTQLGVDISTIRNAIRVWYGDASDLWPDGTPKRKPVEVSDSTSITKYGELWMEIQEDQTSQIDSSTEASALANAALSDLKEPTAELDVPLMRGFPWVELNDYYTFSANGLQFDSDQSVAVTQFQHMHENGKLKTSLQTRGLPTIGASAYLHRRVSLVVPPKFTPHRAVHFNGTKTPGASKSSIVGGHRIQLAQTFDKNSLPEEYEHHIYASAGATLDTTTLKEVSRARVIEVGDLIPAKTYYHRVVPRHRNEGRLVRGQPSVETSFVAGQAYAAHLLDGIALGDYPLNGGFETRFDGVNMPDHWTYNFAGGGVFGTNLVVMEDGNGVSGSRYLRFVMLAGAETTVDSALIPVINEAGVANRTSQLYRLTAWIKNGSSNTAGNFIVYCVLYDYTGSGVGNSSTISVSATSKVGNWQKVEGYITVDSATTIRSVQLEIQPSVIAGGQVCQIDVDEIRLQCVGTPWYNVGDTTKFTDNYESIPGFNNPGTAWANFGNPYAPAGFRRDQFGRVWTRGLVKNGAPANSKIFTLPVGYRPATNKRPYLPTVSNNAFAVVEIADNGDVVVQAGGNAAHVNLDFSFVTF